MDWIILPLLSASLITLVRVIYIGVLYRPGDCTHRYRCVSCNHYLSYSDKMGSHGRCPICGYKAEGARTVVKTNEEIGHWIANGPQWLSIFRPYIWKPK